MNDERKDEPYGERAIESDVCRVVVAGIGRGGLTMMTGLKLGETQEFRHAIYRPAVIVYLITDASVY